MVECDVKLHDMVLGNGVGSSVDEFVMGMSADFGTSTGICSWRWWGVGRTGEWRLVVYDVGPHHGP